MNTFDIIVLILLAWSLWSGWRNGILIQLSGIIGIVLGAWVAYRFSHVIGEWLGLKELPTEVLFIIILLGVMVCVVVLSRAITRLLKAGGLALPLRVLGAAFGVVKGLLLLGLFLLVFETALPWIERNPENSDPDKKSLPTTVKEAKSYPVIQSVGEFVFPYIAEGTRMVIREFREHNSELAPSTDPATFESPSTADPTPADSIPPEPEPYQLIDDPAGTSSDSLSSATGATIES